MRLAAYGAASTAVAVGVILSAFNQRANFYSACVYLAQSNACLMVLTNMMILIAIVIGHGLQRLFYGPLRAMEIEQIYEKAWYAVTETCLAMTIFRDEFDVRFIIMFGVLLFMKCFSWIGGGRVEFMEQQPPERPVLFHIRLASSLVLLCLSCGGMVWHAITAVMDRGKPNMMVMFAFEFAILLITCMGILARYVLSLVEKYVVFRETLRRKEARRIERAAQLQRAETQRIENERRLSAGEEEIPVEEVEEEDDDDDDLDVGGWEEKGTWVFYAELTTDFFKLLTYMSFFWIVLKWYGLPLHIIRDVYLTLRSFITRIRDFIRYRRATAHMNSRYPDATPEEVEREGVCIICREDMQPWVEQPASGARVPDQRHRVKKLPCGHVLHFACLRSWLERQQRCPTCRRPVLEEATAANGDLRNVAPQGNGMAFQAQFGIGPLGFDIGIGGPAIVPNLLDRVQQAQQNQRNQQAQHDQTPQQGEQQPQAQPQAGVQVQQHVAPQAPDHGVAQLNQRGQALGQLQQELAATRQALNDGVVLNQILRALQQHNLGLPAQTATNNNNPTAPTSGQTNAPGTSTEQPNSQYNPATLNAIPLYTYPQPLSSPQSSYPLPAGFSIPPGWTLVPLSGGIQPPNHPSEQSLLNARRNQRSYRSLIHDYHALRTPAATSEADPFSTYRPEQRSSSCDFSTATPITTDTLNSLSLLTSEQHSRLHPISQPTIQLATNLALSHRRTNWNIVNLILAGLPTEIRREVLLAWPEQWQSRLLERLTDTPSQDALETAILAVAEHVKSLSLHEQAIAVAGFPPEFRSAVVSLVEHEDALREEVDRILAEEGLGDSVDWAAQPAPGVWPREGGSETQPETSSSSTQPQPESEPKPESSLSTTTIAPTIHPLSPESRLSLFGTNSIFSQTAQDTARETLDREQREVEERRREGRERERRIGGLVGGILGGGAGGGGMFGAGGYGGSVGGGGVNACPDTTGGDDGIEGEESLLREVRTQRTGSGDADDANREVTAEDAISTTTSKMTTVPTPDVTADVNADASPASTGEKSEKAKGKEIARE